eukprot:13576183-Alexandrium_andersonii.AAC.1
MAATRKGACATTPWARQWPAFAGSGTIVGSCLRPTMSQRWWTCAGLSRGAWACRLRWSLRPRVSRSRT